MSLARALRSHDAAMGCAGGASALISKCESPAKANRLAINLSRRHELSQGLASDISKLSLTTSRPGQSTADSLPLGPALCAARRGSRAPSGAQPSLGLLIPLHCEPPRRHEPLPHRPGP